MCVYQQEVFEARYQKISQENCPVAQQQVDKGKGHRVGSLTTSASSETQSSSEAESSSEEVATQLANLKERVGIYTPVTKSSDVFRLRALSPNCLIHGWLLS